MPRTATLVLVLAACHDTSGDGSDDPSDLGRTPEDVVANASEGDEVTVRGTVHTLTFDSTGAPSDYVPFADRWVLLWSDVPDGVGGAEEPPLALAWGLGVHLVGDAVQGAVPRIGDVVEVSGTFAPASPWNGHEVATLEDASPFTFVTGAPGAGRGEGCALDEDCLDGLVCGADDTCTDADPDNSWDGGWHGINGACDTDADCSHGQVCDPGYTIPAEGEYRPEYHADRDVGRHVCVPRPGASLAESCPVVHPPAELAGGRWVEGRAVCVGGTVKVVVGPEDRDNHVQLRVDQPWPYPAMDAGIPVFGATTEIGPMYKDPSRPQGAMPVPAVGDEIVVLGSYHWDTNHGWWEVHPVIGWWPRP